MLNKEQQFQLKLAGRRPKDPNLGFPNPELDKLIAKIQAESPHFFWQESELHTRNFYSQPDGLHRSEYNSYVMPNQKTLFKEMK